MSIKKLNLTVSILTICVALFHLYRSGSHLLKEVEEPLISWFIMINYLLLSCLIFILAIASFWKKEGLVIFLGILLISLSFGDFLFSANALSFSSKNSAFVWSYSVNIIERIFYWVLAFGFFRRGIIRIRQRRSNRDLILDKF